MSDTSDDKRLETAAQWLNAAAEELGLEPAVLRPLIPDLLELTRDVAHGPSRPGAPLTAYLVGLATGSSEDVQATSRENIARIQALVRRWEEHRG